MNLDFITEMAWKSAAISGAALLLVALFRSRSAADRAAVLRVAVGLLLLLPAISAVLPALKIEALSAPTVAQPADPLLLAELAALDPSVVPGAEPVLESAMPLSPDLLITILYLAGLALALIRLAAGVWTLRRWTREAQCVLSSEWTDALSRMEDVAGSARPVRLLASADVPSALSWGFRRPVILLNSDLLGRPEDAEAIIGHEYAHIVRGDWPQLILSRLVSALFWFNPLVWLLEREVIQHAEEAADNQALKILEPTRYAQTLVSCVRHACRAHLPANSMASSDGMARRVRAVLDGARERTPSGLGWTLAAIVGCTAFAAPLAAVKLVAPEAPIAPKPLHAPEAPLPSQAPTVVALAPASPSVRSMPAPADSAQKARPAAKTVAPGRRAQSAPHELARPIDADAEWLASVRASPADLGTIVKAQLGANPQLKALRLAKLAVFQTENLPQPDQVMVFRQEMSEETRQEIEAATARAVREANRAARLAEQEVARAAREAARAMVQGAAGMERGAEGMEKGARTMAEQARKLRSREYREEVIAREARRGESVTHEDLLRAVPKLEEGSADLLRGAERLREKAVSMRTRNMN